MELQNIERKKFEAKRQIRQYFSCQINYAIWYTVGVVHSMDTKFGDLVTNKKWKNNWFCGLARDCHKILPQCPIKNSIGSDFSLVI